MAAGLAILLKVFDWLTPINEWAEIQKGNLSVAIIMAAVILALGIAVGFAITGPSRMFGPETGCDMTVAESLLHRHRTLADRAGPCVAARC